MNGQAPTFAVIIQRRQRGGKWLLQINPAQSERTGPEPLAQGDQGTRRSVYARERKSSGKRVFV